MQGVNGWCNEDIPNVAHSQDDRSFQFAKSSEAYNFNGHNLSQHMLAIENAVRTLIIIGIVICVLLLVVLVLQRIKTSPFYRERSFDKERNRRDKEQRQREEQQRLRDEQRQREFDELKAMMMRHMHGRDNV
ncbi:hypothetical protein RHSIM_Rhsim10G0025000 [Rhododendron simsii]|uniref:Uncharacterized protein n=1 Tax=Rhododendron simsii TaxID=118357 RepID=A0A834LCW4_RHOSS|nr:hypothetical protein RHSIM_Rhsim10G0025000 [Rhododendron simsii]